MLNRGNELAIVQGKEGFEERFGKFFTKDREEKAEEITNEQLRAAERAQVDEEISNFFFQGQGGSLADLAAMFREAPEFSDPETRTDALKVDDLKVEAEDPFHLKKYEEEKTVFKRRRIENQYVKDPLTGGITQASLSSSNEWVRDETKSGGLAYSRPSYPGVASTTVSSNNPKPGEKAQLFDQIPRVQQNSMDVAYKTPVWKDDRKPDEGWSKYTKKSWWKKTKEFFTSKKGRVMVKIGLLMAMQLGMAIIGKKYEFTGFLQAGAFLSMMLGTFYISKELQSEGFDARGFGI